MIRTLRGQFLLGPHVNVHMRVNVNVPLSPKTLNLDKYAKAEPPHFT
jgi:hypothetical protein